MAAGTVEVAVGDGCSPLLTCQFRLIHAGTLIATDGSTAGPTIFIWHADGSTPSG